MKVNGVAIIAIIAFLSSEVWAQDRVDYPELLVTPRASDRLKIESESEMRRPWNFQWAITVSAMTTLVAGLMQDEDPSKDPQGNSGTVGMLVGGGWLAVNMFMVYGVRGYKSAYDKVAPMPLLFTNHWEDVAQEQQQYKKKIFGPVASTMLLPVMVGERTKFVPGLGLTASF